MSGTPAKVMLRMDCDDSLMPELLNSLRLIVSGTGLDDIDEGWTNLRDLEENGLLQGSVNLDEAKTIMRGILRGSILNLHQVPKLMAYFAKYMKKKVDPSVDECDSVVNDYVTFMELTSGKDITLLASMVEVLKDHPVYRSTSTANAKACKAIVASLGSFAMPSEADKVSEFRSNVARIKDSLDTIRKSFNGFGNSDSIAICLETVYSMISDTRREKNPGPGLICVLELVESRFICQAVKWIMTESRNDEQLEKALKVLCSWVPMWLQVENLSVWIMEFINSLEISMKYDILMRVAESCLKQFLFCIPLRLASYHATLLATVMLCRQPSHELFHKLIKDGTFEKIFAWTSTLNSEISTRCVQSLVAVVKALMERFPGYAIYDNLEKSFPVNPQMPTVIAYRDEHVWSEDHERFFTHEVQSTPLSDNGKVGLTNLGNTCYMNSVLQALAMTKQFSQEVMRHKSSVIREDKGDGAWVASAEEAASIMPKLQNLFALLSYSRRRSLSPTEILAASRPEYFTPGQQQDSSEFLWLLAIIYQQRFIDSYIFY